MAEIDFSGCSALATTVPTVLMELLGDNIQPGSQLDYDTCKAIYEWHPLGAKMVDSPVKMAQSQPRNITIGAGPEDMVRDEFVNKWKEIYADRHIANTARVGRMYGVGTCALIEDGVEPLTPIDWAKLHTKVIGFNIFDPLNTAGSLLLVQDVNSIAYQRVTSVRAGGKQYNPSRTVTFLNEDPLYISYTKSAYGYVGRSVYQRAIYPLKSFIATMRTDDQITRKAGVLVAMIKFVGSTIDNIVAKMLGQKRAILQQAQTDGILSIGSDDKIESLNMQNLEGPYVLARKNILENIAVAADMPAKIIQQETFAEGFGEGTEDAKAIARYIDTIRGELQPLYDWFDKITQYLAWTPEFFKRVQVAFPEAYQGKEYEEVFYSWVNTFQAAWPNLIEEPASEKSKAEKVKLDGVIEFLEVLIPIADPENKAKAIEWACDTINEMKELFPIPLELDFLALAAYEPPVPVAPDKEPGEPGASPRADSVATQGAMATVMKNRAARRAERKEIIKAA